MSDALEAKIDGLSSNMETRFAAHEKEQAGMVAWMERLSASVDRLVDFGSSMLAIQQRTAAIEHQMRDQAVDIDGLDSRMSDIESNRKADNVWLKMTQWGLAATGGAFVTVVIKQLLGDK